MQIKLNSFSVEEDYAYVATDSTMTGSDVYYLDRDGNVVFEKGTSYTILLHLKCDDGYKFKIEIDDNAPEGGESYVLTNVY